MDLLQERIEMALGAMAPGGPRNLIAYLEKPGPDLEQASSGDLHRMIEMILSNDPNHPARIRFSNLLRSWDNAKEAAWTDGTARNTSERRKLIQKRLASRPELVKRIDTILPYFPLDEPIIISEQHHDWYVPRQGVRDYYWSTYLRYLKERGDWGDASLLTLDNTTRAIVECLADPESPAAYASRGLVMGYVQSGKTANFMGVAARAADAGYRLIIVLAGTWNILRNQTQRRFDKELLGKELLANDDAYMQNTPRDWPEFLEHGTDPVELGHYVWQRLTRPDIDFKRLRAAIDNLEFERKDKAQAIYAPVNLHPMPVKLLVVKKHSGIISNLVKDLKLLRTKLADLPTLIIDDESDQAGLNTIDPQRAAAGRLRRPPTNAAMVGLLDLFPRGQYVGYSATPYANALVDPDDPEDLFPKDFIVSLERPAGYMGVSDFFDPYTSYVDLDKTDFLLPEIAFIRRVDTPAGQDDENLMHALRSYVLAGAAKLFRHDRDPARYRARHARHHTMLIHTSQLKGEHSSLAARMAALWDQCAFNSPRGMQKLEAVWAADHVKVSASTGTELMPASFKELVPSLSEAIKRIEKGPSVFVVVNSDSTEAPDFSADSIWKVVVGGNKLSRGYTIEGLTVSYYRRVAQTGDTLMQMGRWFGFRPGYRDLVRVYLGVREGRRADTDLVALFKEVCRMEESFREDIKRYIRTAGVPRITPREIPPLISVSGSLPPTARNKMFNAKIESKNFGGTRSMPTLTAAAPAGTKENIRALTRLLTSSEGIGPTPLAGTTQSGKKMGCDAVAFRAANEQVVTFLKTYHWLESDFPYPDRPQDVALQIEFLVKQKHGISSWLILAPQRKTSFGKALELKGMSALAVKERSRNPGRGFQVFGEPVHRAFGEYFADMGANDTDPLLPDGATEVLWRKHTGVMLIYPVREKESGDVSIGFELLFPKNSLPFDMNFTAIRKGRGSAIVVPTT